MATQESDLHTNRAKDGSKNTGSWGYCPKRWIQRPIRRAKIVKRVGYLTYMMRASASAGSISLSDFHAYPLKFPSKNRSKRVDNALVSFLLC